MTSSLQSLWVGTWDYRSFNNLTFAQLENRSSQKYPNDNDKAAAENWNNLLFGEGTIIIEQTDAPNQLKGSIGDPKRESWVLDLTGSINYGDPFTARFQGKGKVGGHEWIYEYVGYMVNPWQNGVNQVPAFVGSVIRQIPHPGGDGTIHPAGVVASFFCVKEW